MNRNVVKKYFRSESGGIKSEFDYENQFNTDLNIETFIDKAVEELSAFLGVNELPAVVTDSDIAELALIKYKMLISNNRQQGLKSSSYSEGSVSKSETYFTADEYLQSANKILEKYSRYRVVRRYASTKNTE